MPRTKKPVSKKTAPKKVAPKTSKKTREVKSAAVETTTQNIFNQLKLSESYVSLILGAIVVLCLAVLFFIFLRTHNPSGSLSVLTPPPPAKQITNPTKTTVRTYTLQEGEGLWDVAVKFYGDGYRWVDIAKANNMTEEEANAVSPGTKIKIPTLK